MKTMTTKNIAYLGGGALATVIVVINLLNAIRISLGGAFFTEFIPEIIFAVIVAVILYIPAQVLKSKSLDSQMSRIVAFAYPVLMLLSLIMILINGNDLQTQTLAGLVLMISIIYCLGYGIANIKSFLKK